MNNAEHPSTGKKVNPIGVLAGLVVGGAVTAVQSYVWLALLWVGTRDRPMPLHAWVFPFVIPLLLIGGGVICVRRNRFKSFSLGVAVSPLALAAVILTFLFILQPVGSALG